MDLLLLPSGLFALLASPQAHITWQKDFGVFWMRCKMLKLGHFPESAVSIHFTESTSDPCHQSADFTAPGYGSLCPTPDFLHFQATTTSQDLFCLVYENAASSSIIHVPAEDKDHIFVLTNLAGYSSEVE